MTPDQTETAVALGMMGFIVVTVLISTAIALLIWCKLFAKAGYSWALGLLMLVPVANMILPFYLAFADWPVQRELRLLRQQSGGLPR